jgi:hypothetical protein
LSKKSPDPYSVNPDPKPMLHTGAIDHAQLTKSIIKQQCARQKSTPRLWN